MLRNIFRTQTYRPLRVPHQRHFNNMSSRIENPALFICDIQEKFRNAIWEFPKVISTAQKMVKAAKILNIPIYSTTQNASRLGPTVSELSSLLSDSSSNNVEFDKTAFSMMIPDLSTKITAQSQSPPHSTNSSTNPTPVTVLLVGIETHICVTQTALDLLKLGHRVYILADGVSSCNAGERPVALARLAREGAVVTSSESVLFELLGDAKSEGFKGVSGLVKETKEETRGAVETFCRL